MIWMFTISPPVLLMYIQKFTMQLKQTKFQLLPWQRTVCSLLPGYNRQVGQWIQLRQFVVTPIKFLRSQILITYFRCEIHRPYLFVGHSTSIHQISVKGESSRYWAIRSQPLSFTMCIVSIINFPSLYFWDRSNANSWGNIIISTSDVSLVVHSFSAIITISKKVTAGDTAWEVGISGWRVNTREKYRLQFGNLGSLTD